MKITAFQLKRVIQEELQTILQEVATQRFANLDFDATPSSATSKPSDFKSGGRFRRIGADLAGKEAEFSQEQRNKKLITALIKFLGNSKVGGTGFSLVDQPVQQGDSIIFSMNNPEMYSGVHYRFDRPAPGPAAELGKRVIRTLKLEVMITPENFQTDAREQWDKIYLDEFGEWPDEDPNFEEEYERHEHWLGPRPEEGTKTPLQVINRINFRVKNTLPLALCNERRRDMEGSRRAFKSAIRQTTSRTGDFGPPTQIRAINDLVANKRKIKQIYTQINTAYRVWEVRVLQANARHIITDRLADEVSSCVDGENARFPYHWNKSGSASPHPPGLLEPTDAIRVM